MAKVSALFNLGAALEATIEVGRRAAAGDPVAVSGLPTMTLSPATRESLTTYLKNPEALDSRQRNVLEKYLIRSSQEGSSWGSRERMRQSGATEYAGEAQERRIITPEQLYNERANLAPVMGDKSVTGREIVSVQGVPLSKAVMGDGGPGYAQAWEDFNVAWASMEGAAKAKQIHFDKIARDTNGKAPVGVYMAMTDVAMDFNTMTSEGLIRQFKSLDVSKSDKDAFDAAVRESIPEWAGIDSPDAIDQIYGNVPLTSANKKSDALPSSALRKRLVFEFGKKKWQDKGFPVYDDVIVAFTEPALLNAKLGDSGFTMFDTMPGADVVPVVGHNTYDTSIMGKYKGGFEQSVPTEIMFPKLWADLEGQMTVPKEGSRSAPRLLNRQEKIGAIRLGHGYQPADQAWLDGISSWLEKNKGTASSALLATLVSAGIITPQDAEAGVITGFAKGGQKAADMMLQNTADAADQVAVEGIRAYHGSPYSFDEFDFERMGSGVGAQVRGPGGYFSGNENYAEGFKKTTAHKGTLDLEGESHKRGIPLNRDSQVELMRQAAGDADPEKAARQLQNANRDTRGYSQDTLAELISDYRASKSGHMYEVNIDAAAEDFLNWDKPLSEQKKLLDALDDQYGDHEIVLQQLGLDVKYGDPTGGDLADALGMTRGTQTTPPKFLTDAGIKGVEYDFSGFPNYVVFDDKLISIAKKYGVSIPIAAYIAAGTMTPEEASASDIQANQGLVPFDKGIHTSRDVGLGGLSSEYTMTVDAPDGQVAVIPSIWWDTNGEPVVLDQRDAERRSFEYEQETGKQFPRFAPNDYASADKFAQERSKQGGAGQGPLAAYPSLGGMGVRMPPTAEDEEAMLAPTGGDLMQQANRDFADSIRTQPEPDFLTGVQQQLLSGIMKTAGVADLSADVVSAMAGPLLSAPGAIGRYVADRYVPGVNYSAEEMAQGRRETEDYFNYQPRTELGPQYGEQIMQGIGGAIAPYVPAIKKAAGDSYILGAMRQGYDYLGDKEKMFFEALGDIFSPI
jgi:hypothetical protein